MRFNRINLTEITRYGALAASVLACPPALLLADTQTQASTQEEAPVITLSSFKVIGSREAAFSLPGSGTYLTSVDAEKFNTDDINKLLRQVPGVYVREEDGFGLFPNLSLRGVDTSRNSKLTIMEDGILMAPAPYSAPAAYYTPTTARASGVEVLKGSSQIVYGPNSTGGVINYLSTPIPSAWSGSAKVTYGTDNDFRTHLYAGGQAQTQAGTVGVLGEMYHRQNDGFKHIAPTATTPASDATGFERSEGIAKASFLTNTNVPHYFEVSVGRTDTNADETYLGLTQADFATDPYLRYPASRLDNFDSRHERAYLRHKVEWDNFRLSTTAYYNQLARIWYKLDTIVDIDTDGNGIIQGREAVNPAAAGSNPAAALAGARNGTGLEVLQGSRVGLLSIRANNRSYISKGIQTKAEFDLETGSVTHGFELGIRYHEDFERRYQWDDRFLQAADGSWTLDSAGTPGSQDNRKESSAAWALHFLDKVAIGNLTLTPGVRFESIDYTSENFRTNTSGKGNLDVWGYGLGAVYKVQESVNLFAGYHRGFSVPGPSSYIGNGVSEETSDAYELGVRYQSGNSNNLYLETTLFLTDFSDLIVPNIIGAGATGTFNAGDIRSSGVEFAGGLYLYDGGRDGLRIPFRTAITFTEATLQGNANSGDPESVFAGGLDGARVPYIPRWTWNTGIGLELGKFGADLGVSYNGDSYSTALNTDQPVNGTGGPDARYGRIPSYMLVDLSVHYDVTDSLRLFAGANNLFDKEYLASLHPHGPRPGAPRSLYVGVKYDF